MISGPADLLCSRARMDGYRSAMEAADLPLDPDLMQWGDFHVDGGFKEAMAMLSLAHRPTAIFAGSDLQALGVLEAARILQVTVPSQLSLVGFDDLPLSRWTSPPLTTVRQPLAEMAATAVRLRPGRGAGANRPDPAAWSWPPACLPRETNGPAFRLEGVTERPPPAAPPRPMWPPRLVDAPAVGVNGDLRAVGSLEPQVPSRPWRR